MLSQNWANNLSVGLPAATRALLFPHILPIEPTYKFPPFSPDPISRDRTAILNQDQGAQLVMLIYLPLVRTLPN